jgi:hypothetical protein
MLDSQNGVEFVSDVVRLMLCSSNDKGMSTELGKSCVAVFACFSVLSQLALHWRYGETGCVDGVTSQVESFVRKLGVKVVWVSSWICLH